MDLVVVLAGMELIVFVSSEELCTNAHVKETHRKPPWTREALQRYGGTWQGA